VKVLVVGSGGREHALAWKLLQSPQVEQVWCTPGNGGTAILPNCQNVDLGKNDFDALAHFCHDQGVALVVVGPEVPLAAGIADVLRQRNLRVFGPSQAGAQIEASKAWAKALMQEAGVPTAASRPFSDLGAALAYVRQQSLPIVVKADGLAAGKGVVIATTLAVAEQAIQAAFAGEFGAAGHTIVIEECLTGPEISLLAITDGVTYRTLAPAQDHKRIGEGDTGLNTGGMGAYAPAPLLTPALLAQVEQEILEPTIQALRQRGIDYRGVLYAGLMLTPSGPQVIEFNCRFGDPETQTILPLLETPLIDILLACSEGRLSDLPPLKWAPAVSACVVTSASGYPGTYPKGDIISGLDEAAEADALVFHAGTRLREGQIITSGGRVLNVVALGDDFDQAFARAYHALNDIHFDGIYYRRDIGWQVRHP
jgi:phosphoribosylamine---glycine ligase